MNRKVTREQNDISIIIGNLPKRLQKKIAEKAGSTTGGHISEKDELNTKTDKRVLKTLIEKERKVCNFAPVLEASGETPNGEKNGRQSEKRADTTPIPGILRIKSIEPVKVIKAENDEDRVTENGRKAVRPQRNGAYLRAEMPSSPGRFLFKAAHHAQPHPSWFDNIEKSKILPLYARSLIQYYDNFFMLIRRNAVIENWQDFCNIRIQLQKIFSKLLLCDLKFCCEEKVDTFFWKLLFYNVREYLENEKTPQASVFITELIEDGLEFYTGLHEKLTSKYLTPSAAVSQNGEKQQNGAHKFETIAKVTAQKFLICLGDLSRYKVKQLQNSDYTEAAKYYQQAQSLIPTNGIPYNQLAIVAMYARKKFDAIYFYMRSLMSSNAIYSAGESLLVLFDEIRKKYEETEMKTSPIHQIRNGINGKNSKPIRQEVWINPNGVRRFHCSETNGNLLTSQEEKRLNEMSADDLLRRLTSTYLYLIGKLYAGIGMETILEHQKKLLTFIYVVLNRNPFAITRLRVLKMVALNIFILEHNKQNELRREVRYRAFNFCNEIFGLILRKCNYFLALYNDDVAKFEENITDLNTLLQYVKVYADWLTRNVDIWEPVRCKDHSFVDYWKELVQLFAHINYIQSQNSISNGVEAEYQEQVFLEEDYFLLGFSPLIGTYGKQYNNNELYIASEIVQFNTRISKIASFQKCFEENEKRLVVPKQKSTFILEELGSALKALDSSHSDEENTENIIVNGLNKSKSAIELNLKNGTNETLDAQTLHLTKLKKELEAKNNASELYKAKFEKILKAIDLKLYIEVRPKYLLPDTNCFIDCLEDFKILLTEFKSYTLIIPVTVVKELDGLSKGVKYDMEEKSLTKHRLQHFEDVSANAKKSLDFIKSSTNNIKFATTKGSIIKASLFDLVQEEYASNDDKILATALALSENLGTKTSKNGLCFIRTELVLITTDRNLRVKALSRNLAVSELSEFLKWAKDCNQKHVQSDT